MSPMSTAAMNAVHVSEGRPGFRAAVDVADGRRHLRRRGARRDLPGRQPNRRSSRPPRLRRYLPAGSTRSPQQLGSGGLEQTLSKLPPDVAQQAADRRPRRVHLGLTTAIGISAAVAAGGAVLAWLLIAAQTVRDEAEQDMPGDRHD